MLKFFEQDNNRKRKSLFLDENNNEVSKRSRLSDNDDDEQSEISSSVIEMLDIYLDDKESILESFRLEKGNLFEMNTCDIRCSTSNYLLLQIAKSYFYY
jgi:hypothetical protein